MILTFSEEPPVWQTQAQTRRGCGSHRCNRQRHAKAGNAVFGSMRLTPSCRLTTGRKRPATVGFFFALGHSTVVVVVCRAYFDAPIADERPARCDL